MPGTIKIAKPVARRRLRALIAGLEQHFPAGSLTLLGTSYATAALAARLQSLLDAIDALDAAQAAARDAVTALGQAKDAVGPVQLACERLLHSMFGPSSQALGDFGLSPTKVPSPRTSEQRAAAAAKARATRQARGTMGRRQRARIQGDVTGVVITPVVTGSGLAGRP